MKPSEMAAVSGKTIEVLACPPWKIGLHGGGSYSITNSASGQNVTISHERGNTFLRSIESAQDTLLAIEDECQTVHMQPTAEALTPVGVPEQHVATVASLTNKADAQDTTLGSPVVNDGIGHFFEHLAQRGMEDISDDAHVLAMTYNDFVAFMIERFGALFYTAAASNAAHASVPATTVGTIDPLSRYVGFDPADKV